MTRAQMKLPIFEKEDNCVRASKVALSIHVVSKHTGSHCSENLHYSERRINDLWLMGEKTTDDRVIY